MTDTTTTAASAAPSQGSDTATGGALTGLRLPQLQAIAAQLGVRGTSKMRKSDLLEAIRSHQGGSSRPSGRNGADNNGAESKVAESKVAETKVAESRVGDTQGAVASTPSAQAPPARRSRRATSPAGSATQDQLPVQEVSEPSERPGSAQDRSSGGQDDGTRPARQRETRQRDRHGASQADRQDPSQADQQGERQQREDSQGGQNDRHQRGGQTDRQQQGDKQQDDKQNDRQQNDRQQGGQRDRPNDRNQNRQNQNQNQNQNRQDTQNRQDNGPDDDEEGGGRRRRNRYRDRKRRGRGSDPMGGMSDEPEVSEDDVLLPVAGILDVLDSYGFIRTSGYLPGDNDVYVSLGQVKKHFMRKGDAVVGAVRAPRENEQNAQRQKFNALVRVDSVNGQTPEQAKARADFMKLTPLYPQERLRLETEPNVLTTRVLDLVAPIGKGQRALIVSPPKAGKTMMMQAIANAITQNNPEVHLMVVLVDERPEEVTDFQRSVKGEVIASTFDRPASDHTTVAELAIERAKRLVEMGHDVVILLDGITRLGRAYNISAPASGRILSGGVDSSALYPPKRFFGAARNIENGGSLTIIATALVETGSKADEVIFEEFKGTGNSEFRLSRSLADKRVYPAVDVNSSGTRREEVLLGREELAVMWKLRRVLTALDSQQAIELLLSKLRETKTNTEFLMQIQKTTAPLMSNGKDA